jgi:hypothetical protein
MEDNGKQLVDDNNEIKQYDKWSSMSDSLSELSLGSANKIMPDNLINFKQILPSINLFNNQLEGLTDTLGILKQFKINDLKYHINVKNNVENNIKYKKEKAASKLADKLLSEPGLFKWVEEIDEPDVWDPS